MAFLVPLLLPQNSRGQICFDCGDGHSGPLMVLKDSTLPSGVYNFTDVYIAEGTELRFSGNSAIVFRCKGSVVVDGKINLAGENGQNANDNLTSAIPGQGAPGGYSGASGMPGNLLSSSGQNGNGTGYGPGGISAGGAGAGYGSAGYSCQGTLFNTYSDSSLVLNEGGSGGGSGAVINGYSSGAGGGGGGNLSIYSCNPIIIGIHGEINLNGGNGGDGYQYGTGGGGGSGGRLFLTAKSIDIQGLVTAIGGSGGKCPLNSAQCYQGGNGGNGRIRIDNTDITLTGIVLPGHYSKVLFDAGIRRVVDAKCFGTATGFIRGRASGGEHPYTFLWSNGKTSHELTNIPAGTYTLTITDATGCSITEHANVAQPDPIEAAVSTYPPTCDNANNSIVIYNAKGGTPFPYENTLATTQWSNISANGLLFSFNFNTAASVKRIALQLKQPGNQHLSIYYRQGIATAFANDSTQWQLIKDIQFNYNSTEDLIPIDLTALQHLASGNHTLYIYSYNSAMLGVSSNVLGNTFNFDHQMTIYAGMARATGNDPFSAPQSGIMNLSGRITYIIDAPNGENYLYGNNPNSLSIQTGQSPGEHQTIITDVMGCTTAVDYKIEAPESVTIEQLTSRSPACHNSDDGYIEVNVNNTDLKGYAATPPSATIPQSGIFLQYQTNENILLNGIELYSSTAVNVSVYLKRGVYSGFENDVQSWVLSGTVNSTAPDDGGRVKIFLPNGIALDPDVWSICIQVNTGSIYTHLQRENFIQSPVLHLQSTAYTCSSVFNQVTFIPGIYFAGTLTYTIPTGQLNSYWSNAVAGNILQNIGAGTYTFTVDYNGMCKTEKTFILNEPAPISAQVMITPENDNQSDGSIQLYPAGGTPPYFIQWTQTGITGPVMQQLPAGTYPVFIADSHGCIFRDSITLNRFNTPIKEEGWLTILPNPGHGYIKVGEEVKGMENCTLRVFDILGRMVLQENTSISSLMSEGIDLHHLIDANYILQVSDEDQVFQARAIIIH